MILASVGVKLFMDCPFK